MEITIHEENFCHSHFTGKKKGPITSHENTVYHPRSTPTKPPAKNSNICLSEIAYQHKGTRKKCKKTNQAAIIQWQRQCLMDKPLRKPWPKSKTSKQSPSPLHHTFLLGGARFPPNFYPPWYPGAFPPVLENFRRAISPGRTDCPWVSEDGSGTANTC